MSNEGPTSIQRLQTIMTALMERHLVESLEKVDLALGEWKEGKASVFDTHAELLRHAALAERMAERMARIGLDNAGSLLRDAYDAELIGREEFISFVGKAPEEVKASPPLTDPKSAVGLPDKRGLIEELLGEGPVLVHIDARRADVKVPERFAEDPKLVLRFGYGLTPAIVDLSIDDEGMCGTLTFGGVPFRCILPWESIYSVVSEADHKGMVWPDDVPDCVVESIASQTGAAPKEESARAKLNVTSGEGGRASSESGDEPPKPPAPKRGGHLKLVK